MTSVSGLWSSLTFAGYSTNVNTSAVTDGLTTVSSIATNYYSITTFYVIGTRSENATIYYNNNTTCEGMTITSTTVSTTATHYCSSTSAATNKKVYRNQWLSSKTALADTVLATTATGTTSNASEGSFASSEYKKLLPVSSFPGAFHFL